jgi:hypothetical protein
MEIVIDIPEETVNEIKDNVMFADNISSDIRWGITSAIVNGTPLLKGHGRLIDADALIEQIKKSRCIDCNSIDGVRCRACQYDDEMADIDGTSTIIEADKELEQPDKCKFFKDADCCYPIEDCDNCPNHKEDYDWAGEGD